jgi:hypothetical protein
MSLFVDFQPPFAWTELNDQAEETLGIKAAGGAVKVVAGTRQALTELTLGLVRQFPHKRRVCYFRDLDPGLEGPVVQLAREGCQILALEGKLLRDPAALEAAIGTDALFVLASEDDPLLGLLHDLSPLEALSEKNKFYLIKVSHAHHRFLPVAKIFPRHLIRVNALAPRLALILSSARTRWPIQFADSVALSADSMQPIARLASPEFIDPAGVPAFESSYPADAKPVFDAGRLRILDRAVIYWPDMDGLSVLELLSRRLKRPLSLPGESGAFETTSMNRWRGVHTMDWLRAFGFSDEMIRGTIILSHSVISPELTQALVAVRQEIMKAQFG